MELLNFPNNKVASSFICAISTVPYYMNKYKEWVDKDVDFNELPFTTKDDIIDSKLPMINITCQEKFRRGELRMGRSSGTTGKITEIFYDPQEHTKSLQELWFYRLKWYGIHAGKDKVLYFYPTPDQTPMYQDTPTKVTISKPYLFSKEKIIETFAIIRNAKPDYCIIQPSTAVVLYKTWQEAGLAPIMEMRYIEFNGEFLEPQVIENIKKVFPNAQVSNQYGLQELQSVGFTCPEGHMHLMVGNCYTEIVNQDKEGIGDICITTLKNSIMPYIRFITGDKGKIDYDTKCKCGCKNPILHLTRGRNNDFIRRPDGNLMHPYVLLQLIEQITNEILQYRITQTDYNSFTFELVITNPKSKSKIENVVRKFLENEYLHCAVDLKFIYHDMLFPERETGKQTVFICTMEDK